MKGNGKETGKATEEVTGRRQDDTAGEGQKQLERYFCSLFVSMK